MIFVTRHLLLWYFSRLISEESNPKVQPCVTLVEILGFFNIQIEDKGEIKVKKEDVSCGTIEDTDNHNEIIELD